METEKAAKKTKAKKAAPAATQTAPANVSDYTVLVSPLVTEKSSLVAGAGNRVVFRVRPGATKLEIKQAVERIYKVQVTSVRTSNLFGKGKRTNKGLVYRPNIRKAYVTIKEGQSIDVVEGL